MREIRNFLVNYMRFLLLFFFCITRTSFFPCTHSDVHSYNSYIVQISDIIGCMLHIVARDEKISLNLCKVLLARMKHINVRELSTGLHYA